MTHHAQDDIDAAIAAFEASIALEPSSDAFNNLSLLHVSRKPPDTARALELLRRAVEHAPSGASILVDRALIHSDPEVRYNLAVVLEASDKLDEALRFVGAPQCLLSVHREYTAAKDLGVERAAVGIRNVGGKVGLAPLAALLTGGRSSAVGSSRNRPSLHRERCSAFGLAAFLRRRSALPNAAG